MFLLHSFKEAITLLDCEGRSYRIPPNEPWEVPTIRGTDIPGQAGQPAYREFTIPPEKVAEDFIAKARYYGLVRCAVYQVPGGTRYGIEEAIQASNVARRQAEDAMVQTYVKASKEDELAKLPVRPPPPVIERILTERGLDLKRDFGITPVGYRVSEGAKQRDAEIAALQKQNAELLERMDKQQRMIEDLLENATKSRKKEPVTA